MLLFRNTTSEGYYKTRQDRGCLANLLSNDSNIEMLSFDPIRDTKYFWQQNENLSGPKERPIISE